MEDEPRPGASTHAATLSLWLSSGLHRTRCALSLIIQSAPVSSRVLGKEQRLMRTLIFVVGAMIGAASVQSGEAQETTHDSWTSEFNVEPAELTTSGRNPYFILEPGYRLILEGGRERLVVTVLDEMKRVDGVDTRIVEERETDNGQLIEVS